MAIPIFISVFLVSLLSFAGIFWLTLSEQKLRRVLLFLVSFSAGALLGDTFLHILPKLSGANLFISSGLYVLAGIFIFLILEKIIHWRHCHILPSQKHLHPAGPANLAADTLHNFIDGMIIAGSFLVSWQVGLATTLAVIFHEIPQEIGNLAVLLYAGFSRKRALFFNFASALAAFLGAALVLSLGQISENFLRFILALTAGGFIYIACTDLIPEIHKEPKLGYSIGQLIFFVGGVAIMALLLLLD